MLLALSFSWWLIGCATPEIRDDLTGIELTVTHEEGLLIDQIDLVISDEAEAFLDPDPIPEVPRELAAEGESVVILLPDERGETTVSVTVIGLATGVEVAEGSVEVELITRTLVEALVHLEAPTLCGNGRLDEDEECDDGDVDPDDGCSEECVEEPGYTCTTPDDGPSICGQDCADSVCEPGQRCLQEECVCDEVSCHDGCCEQGSCHVQDHELCGVGGGRCTSCDAVSTDTCSVEGDCTCGQGAPCGAGQRCQNGLCICDGNSCSAGCCDGTTCLVRTFETCGIGGDSCVACDEDLSDSCSSEGRCLCGQNDPCELGQRCHSGVCYCDELSCPNGCCTDGECRTPSLGACGLGGEDCDVCNAEFSDQCSLTGECACGEGAPCQQGARCHEGACVCDEVSCPLGCCIGIRCEELSMVTCGQPGTACEACSTRSSNQCSATGACLCGSNPACPVGERCDNGNCTCDPNTCLGCCQAGSCLDGDSSDACGSGGAPCQICPDGEACRDGSCASCNETSCADGCCSGATCYLSSLATCGITGTNCTACDPERADACSPLGACVCGDGQPCEDGQRCDDGVCICDETSCDSGCCESNSCVAGTSDDACGLDGGLCEVCVPDLEWCVDGLCQSCSPVTCPAGCCAGAICMEPSLETCGYGGAPCVACDLDATDTCHILDGCRCGNRAPCLQPKVCVDGGCAVLP